MILETERLILRKLTLKDAEEWHKILSDPESMAHYPSTYTFNQTKAWIEKNTLRYNNEGFGLWAAILKENNMFVGDCGISLQVIDGVKVPEIGYHINKKYTGKGLATEAAIACRNYGFNELGLKEIYSYMKYTNIGSYRVAEKNGMSLIKEYKDPINTIVKVYRITREEYLINYKK